MYGGAPLRLNKYMSRNRFEGILGSIQFTDQNNFEYYDRSFHMHQMEEAWKLNMAEEFNISQINVLYKSLMAWFNK